MNRIRIVTVILSVAVGVLLSTSYRMAMDLHKSERLEGVGGVEVYRAQRVAALLAMKDKLNVRDPEVRRLQLDEIDQQIAEIESEPVWELGPELKIKRNVK
jgi:hypothetical protein